MDRERGNAVLPMELIALSLLANGRQAFASADDVADLPDHVVLELGNALHGALRIVSPLYGRANSDAWGAVLRAGAAASQSIAIPLGGSRDDGPHRTAPRPDRYFGKPLIALTDGQWMAYRAAASYLDDITPKPKALPRRR